LGDGPLTGRGAGYCGGGDRPGGAERETRGGCPGGRGRGAARRRAGGRGWRHRYQATGLPGWARDEEQHAAAEPGGLAALAQRLAAALDAVRARLAEMPTEGPKSEAMGRGGQ
jgi:hypothetical protein